MPPHNPRPFLNELAAPAAYHKELAALTRRHAGNARRPWEQQGLALADVSPRAQALIAKELARLVSAGEYRFSPSVARTSHIGGKERVLYRANITDTAVVAVVAKVLRRLCEPLLSPHVYSYRSGRSSLEAVRDFAAFVRAHRASVPDPRARGLFVFRRDVTRYGESIPVHEGSKLWSMLQGVFGFWGMTPGEPIVSLVSAAVRPFVVDEQGTHQLECGVPTGSAIQPVINNLYLGELDRALGSVSGGFYGRFGDDILFAHPNDHVFAEAHRRADALVTSLGLTFKSEKTRDLFFNAAGRSATFDAAPAPSAERTQAQSAPPPPGEARAASQHGTCRGTAFVEYLGLRLDFSGAIGLPTAKARRLLRELSRRLDNVARLSAPNTGRSEPSVRTPHAQSDTHVSHPNGDRTAPARRNVDDDAALAPGAKRSLDDVAPLASGAKRGLEDDARLATEAKRRRDLPEASANGALPNPEADQRRELLCRAAASTLNPKSSLTQTMVPVVAHAVDDRGQLRHLDHLIALRVAQHLSRRRGVRAFRDVSYASLREAGLPSLLAQRNRR